jgi:hypothetical protein
MLFRPGRPLPHETDNVVSHSFVLGRVGRGLLVAAFVMAAGCGFSGKSSGRVAGAVSLRGQPFTEGTVNFVQKEKGIGAVAVIDSEGKYSFEQPLETGTYSVFVTPPTPEPGVPGAARPRAPRKIPARYLDPGTSGLSYTVKSGRNDYPITLQE